jgi:hypothetical protein
VDNVNVEDVADYENRWDKIVAKVGGPETEEPKVVNETGRGRGRFTHSPHLPALPITDEAVRQMIVEP